jgi:AAA+ ATPase superfamily predicted ATPase
MIPIDSDMFFGREREMQRIADMLSGETPQCVSIIGERRIGKSSLANRVFHGLRTAPGSRTVYLDCDGLPADYLSKDQFFQFLNQKFLEAEALAPQPDSRVSVEKGKKNLFAIIPPSRLLLAIMGEKASRPLSSWMNSSICLAMKRKISIPLPTTLFFPI